MRATPTASRSPARAREPRMPIALTGGSRAGDGRRDRAPERAGHLLAASTCVDAHRRIPHARGGPAPVSSCPRSRARATYALDARTGRPPSIESAHCHVRLASVSCHHLVVNLAAELVAEGPEQRALRGRSRAQLGDVFVALDLQKQPRRSPAWPETSGPARAGWDEASLRRRMVRHDSGIYALTARRTTRRHRRRPAENLPALLARPGPPFRLCDRRRRRRFHRATNVFVPEVADDVAMNVTQIVAPRP